MQYSPSSLDCPTLGSLRAKIVKRLATLDSPFLEADLILTHILKVDRSWVHAHPEYVLTPQEQESIASFVKRREAREPLQYILGSCNFDGLDLIVTEGCLVPRPETEFLVQCASDHFDGSSFLDWGTGTGCISIALLHRFPRSFAYMAEKNPKSIECASKNLDKFGMSSRAKLIKTNSPEDIMGFKVSLIVSNPPYIPTSQIDKLMPEVSFWEPRMALDGGEDGLAPYNGLFALGKRLLLPNGMLCVEYGGNEQTEILRSLAPNCFVEIEALRDISGQDRVIAWKILL